MGRESGGLVVAFAGAVLVILAVKGTLGDVWKVLTGGVALTKDSKGNVTGAKTMATSSSASDAAGSATGTTFSEGTSVSSINSQGNPQLVSYVPQVGVPGSGVAPDAVPVPGEIVSGTLA